MNASAPTSTTTLASSRTNSGVCVGSVPALGGTSRLITAPCAPAAAVLAALAIEFTQEGLSPEAVLVRLALIGLVCALLQLAFGVVGIGRLIKYMPYPVVSGYLTGVGLIIIGSQVPRLLGAPGDLKLIPALVSPSAWHWQSALVGGIVIAAMVLMPRVTRRIPAAVLALVAIVLPLAVLLAFQLVFAAIWLLRDVLDRDGHAREAIGWSLRAWRIPAYVALTIAAWQVLSDSYVAFRLGVSIYEFLLGLALPVLLMLLAPWFCWQRRVLLGPSPHGWWRPGWPGWLAVAAYVACGLLDAGFEGATSYALDAVDASTALVAIGMLAAAAVTLLIELLQARFWLFPRTPVREQLRIAFAPGMLKAAIGWALGWSAIAPPIAATIMIVHLVSLRNSS